MYYYAISTYRTSRNKDSGRLMLYRFKTKRARNAFVNASYANRADIPRDVARVVFPKFRYHSQDEEWWVYCEIPNPEVHEDGTRAAHIRCGYFYDADKGEIVTAPFEIAAAEWPQTGK